MLDTLIFSKKSLPNGLPFSIALAIFVSSLLGTTQLFAQPTGSLTLFGRIAHSDVVSDASITERDEQSALAVDLLGKVDYGRFQLLVETVVANREINHDHISVERFKLGYRFSDSTQLWVGKFHNAAEYWLHEYHQGYYIQPSITAPFESLTAYSGGITSKDLPGIRLDKQWLIGENAHQIKTSFTLADTPEISNDQATIDIGDCFSDFDLDNLMRGVKLAYHPDLFSDSSIGFSYSKGRTKIEDKTAQRAGGTALTLLAQGGVDVSTLLPIQDQLFSGIKLDVEHFGGFVNLENDHGRILYSDSTLKYDIKLTDSVAGNFFMNFIGGSDRDIPERLRFRYIHGEYHFNGKWSVFARHEKVSSPSGQASILPLLDEFGVESNYQKTLVGVRFDPVTNHAITVQYTDHETFVKGREDNIHLNWTFVMDWGF